MYEMEHCDHTLNILASSLHKTLMFPMVIVTNLHAKSIMGKGNIN